jgi:uridylate kinase
MYKKVVLSVGGSIVIPDEIDVAFVKGFAKLLKKYKKKIKFSIVVGGGKTSRRYALTGKQLGLGDRDAHELGIAATHINAMFLAKIVGGKFSDKAPAKIGKMGSLMVSGGYKPGCSTDTDAAEIAESMKADVLVNITDVKGVYTKNPKKYKDAKFLAKLNWKKFFEIVGTKFVPSGHYVFDPIAAKICRNKKIKVVVLSNNLRNFENFLKGKKFIGSIIE